MSRFFRSAVGLAIIVVALCAAAYSAYAQQQTQGKRTVQPSSRSIAVPTLPPLPAAGSATPLPGATSAAAGGKGYVDFGAYMRSHPGLTSLRIPTGAKFAGPRPPIPSMRSLLNGKVRRTKSASGGSITLTGSSSTPFLDDQTLAYNTFVFWVCENMTPATQYRYVIFEPNGNATNQSAHNYQTGGTTATFTTDAAGRCASGGGGTADPYYAQGFLGTPFTGAAPGTDAGYSGVWAIAVQNVATSAYEAVAYTVIIGSQSLQTYSDPSFTTPSNDFTPGSTVYANATGLNPSHSYAFGFVNTSGNGIPCVSAVPPGSQNVNNNTCFKSPTTGVLAAGGSVGASFLTPTLGLNNTGTYSLELYDATELSDSGGPGVLVGTRQFSLSPGSVTMTLTPVNTAGTTGVNL